MIYVCVCVRVVLGMISLCLHYDYTYDFSVTMFCVRLWFVSCDSLCFGFIV